jgi:hypothetical protein
MSNLSVTQYVVRSVAPTDRSASTYPEISWVPSPASTEPPRMTSRSGSAGRFWEFRQEGPSLVLIDGHTRTVACSDRGSTETRSDDSGWNEESSVGLHPEHLGPHRLPRVGLPRSAEPTIRDGLTGQYCRATYNGVRHTDTALPSSA